MNLKTIYIGSWFPKTNMHLREFEDFLKTGRVVDGLDSTPAKKLHDNLHPQNVGAHTNTHGLKHVHAESGSFTFTYFGDGLLVIKKTVADTGADTKAIVDFYKKKLSPVLAYLFSRGAKSLDVIRNPGSKKTIFFNSDGDTNEGIRGFFQSLGHEIHSVNNYKGSSAYYAEDMILLNCDTVAERIDCDDIISHLILFNEVKRHTYRLLQTHRYVWDEADRIISESRIRVKDLPMYNEKLTNFSNMVDNINVRIDQMKLNFLYRQEKLRSDEVLYSRLTPNFENLQQNLDYVKNLFQMTHQHLQNNIAHITNIYEENQETALNRLQLLFLLSVVAAFASLGTYIVQDPSASYEVSNNFIGFNPGTLVRFGGISFVATIIIYYLWNFTYQNVKTKLKK